MRMDRAMVMENIAKAPSDFTVTPRNPDQAIRIGGNAINFGLVSGPPNVHDNINGRRPGNLDDYRKLISFGQYFNVLTFFGNQATPPTDLPANSRHLDSTLVNLTQADKAFFTTGIGAGRSMDAIEMCAIALGKSLDELNGVPSVMTNINVNSPRKLDDTMAYGAMQMAAYGQPVAVTPFTLMGAMTPVTMAGALAQQNAEALFCIVLLQINASGNAGNLRRIHFECEHAIRVAGFRDAGEQPGQTWQAANLPGDMICLTEPVPATRPMLSMRRPYTKLRWPCGVPYSVMAT